MDVASFQGSENNRKQNSTVGLQCSCVLLSRSMRHLLHKHSPGVLRDPTYDFFLFLINTKPIDHRKLKGYRKGLRYIYINSKASQERQSSLSSGTLSLTTPSPCLICQITSFERKFGFVVIGPLPNGIKQLVQGLLKLI